MYTQGNLPGKQHVENVDNKKRKDYKTTSKPMFAYYACQGVCINIITLSTDSEKTKVVVFTDYTFTSIHNISIQELRIGSSICNMLRTMYGLLTSSIFGKLIMFSELKFASCFLSFYQYFTFVGLSISFLFFTALPSFNCCSRISHLLAFYMLI